MSMDLEEESGTEPGPDPSGELHQGIEARGLPGPGGPMATLIRTYDWSRTALGPVDLWPSSLRTAAGLCLASRCPTLIWWGPDCIRLYNDAYHQLLGDPESAPSLGLPGRGIWEACWNQLEPLLQSAFSRGQSSVLERQRLELSRNGRIEERLFDVCLSPIVGEAGAVGGVFAIINDITEQVAAELYRARLRALAQAADEVSAARSLESILYATAEHVRLITGAQLAVGVGCPGRERPGVFSAVSCSSSPGERPLGELAPNGGALLSLVAGLSGVVRCDRASLDENWTSRLRGLGFPEELLSSGFIAVSLTDLEGGQLGALLVACPSSREFTDDDEALTLQLARTTSLALENILLRRSSDAAARARDEFLTTLSHELRTPLTTILGWSRILRTGEFDPVVRDRALETIDRNARIQARLIDDLLDTSHIMAGKLRIDPQPIELEPLIRDAVESMRSEARSRGIDLRIDLESEVSSVVGDPARLRQVTLNLLSNAVKFTPPGGWVRVRLDQIGPQIRLEVSDTGEGISEEFLPHVFERFRQADGSTSRSHTGLGLGLAIVRSVTQLHGGTVRVSSGGVGKGATFTVLLPAASPASRPAPGPEKRWDRPDTRERRNSHARALEGKRILLVDDNTDTLELLSSLLEEAGARVRGCKTASRALAEISEWSPDLLISDLGLPDESGYAFIRKVRALPPGMGAQVPALLLTAYAGDAERVQALKAGFQKFLAKPALPAELLEASAELVGRKMGREAL